MSLLTDLIETFSVLLLLFLLLILLQECNGGKMFRRQKESYSPLGHTLSPGIRLLLHSISRVHSLTQIPNIVKEGHALLISSQIKLY